LPIFRSGGESIEAKQILLVFERMISDKVAGRVKESVVEGNPAQAVIRTVWKYVEQSNVPSTQPTP
jgi:hypothetical protein